MPRKPMQFIVTVSSTGENALPQVHRRLIREYLEEKAREAEAERARLSDTNEKAQAS